MATGVKVVPQYFKQGTMAKKFCLTFFKYKGEGGGCWSLPVACERGENKSVSGST